MKIIRNALVKYVKEIFIAKGLPECDALITAEVLIAADARGIPSHGLGRLWRYLAGIDKGVMKIDAETEILAESPVSLVIDAGGGMGAPVSNIAMKNIIGKAQTAGMAFASVRDSNHFGIAAYYAMMGLHEDMIGIAMTNTAALGVPTFGRNVMFGTNPIAVAVPAASEIPFVLDMSTTVVSRGKIEVYERQGKELPPGWAVNEKGLTAFDPGPLLQSMLEQAGGGIMPLGGEGESYGGYKGYGLAVLVDIMTSVLSGADYGPAVKDTAATSARVSHFFGAIKISAFRDPALFKTDMDQMLRQLRLAEPAEGQERVYYAGLKEAEHEIEAEKTGVSLSDKVWSQVCAFGDVLGVPRPPTQ